MINPNTPRGAQQQRDMEALKPAPKKVKKKAKKKAGTSTTE
jgi:hypothetical protein